MAAIKLIKINELENGTVRLQSQLSFIFKSDEADFVLKDGVLKVWGYGDKGFAFYKYDKPYVIVEDKKEMMFQEL